MIIGTARSRVLVVCCLTLALMGCATGTVRFGERGAKVDAAAYKTVAIKVVNDAGAKCPAEVPENLQASAIKRMKTSYPGVFEDVRPDAVGAENELLAEVHITKYKQGSRLARSILIGLGASKISTTLSMMDARNKELLSSGNLDLVWAVGGMVGASKGIEDLVDDAGGKIADAVVAFKRGTEQQGGPGAKPTAASQSVAKEPLAPPKAATPAPEKKAVEPAPEQKVVVAPAEKKVVASAPPAPVAVEPAKPQPKQEERQAKKKAEPAAAPKPAVAPLPAVVETKIEPEQPARTYPESHTLQALPRPMQVPLIKPAQEQ